MAAKTRAELDNLKAQWEADPHWDLEDTPGFEAHRDELYMYRVSCELLWATEEHTRLAQRARDLGCHIALVQYIEHLEKRLERLEEMNNGDHR